jgi:hypothetical protein
MVRLRQAAAQQGGVTPRQDGAMRSWSVG